MSTSFVERFNIEKTVGVGAHGTVLRAQDTLLDRTVALKRLRVEGADDIVAKQMLDEARLLAQIKHPNIVTLFEVTDHEQAHYLVMEYVDGVGLADYVAAAHPDMPMMLAIALKIADALSAVHAKGIVHADIKPANIMIATDGEPVLVDFGLAKLASRSDDLETMMTGAIGPSSIRGTLPYMAPEVITGGRPDARSDIFSFGAVLLELLAGENMFRGETEAATMNNILTKRAEIGARRARDIPEALLALVFEMIEKRPEDRPLGMDEVATRLRAFVSVDGASSGVTPPRSGRRYRPALALAATGLIAIMVWGGVLMLRPEPSVSARIEAGLEHLKNFQEEGATERAIAEFQAVLVKKPENAAANAGLSMALLSQVANTEMTPADVAQARSAAQLALNSDSHMALAHVAMALVHEYSGNPKQAEASYREALGIEPNNFFAIRGLMETLARSRRDNEAFEVLERATTLFPKHSRFFDEIGAIHFRRQHFDAAKAAFQRSIELSPDSAFAYANLSAIAYVKNDLLGAIGIIQKGLRVRPHHILYNNLGTYYFALGQYAQAVAAFERALEMKANSADYLLWANLADAYRWTEGQQDKAPAAYRQALGILSKQLSSETANPTPFSRAALFNAKAGQKVEALEMQARALGLAPNDANVLFRAVVTSEILGERDKALQYAVRALDQGYPLSVLQQDPELAQLRQSRGYRELLLNHQQPAQGDDDG